MPAPALLVGCGVCEDPIESSTEVSPFTYEIPAHPFVQGKVDLCLNVSGTLTYVGPLFVSGVDIDNVRAVGTTLKVPHNGASLDLIDKVALATTGSPCSQPEAVLSSATTSTSSLYEFTAPEGRYKVCFCDATAADCTEPYNFFEVAADIEIYPAEGLSCLTAQPQLLQSHCYTTTDIVPGSTISNKGTSRAPRYAADVAVYDYECAGTAADPLPRTPAPPVSNEPRRRSKWTSDVCSTSDSIAWPRSSP
jgi:hypothetical protein